MCCGNIMARVMILNNFVELNRKSSDDETGSMWQGHNARVLSVWRETDVEMMLCKMRFCIRTVSSDRINNRLQYGDMLAISICVRH